MRTSRRFQGQVLQGMVLGVHRKPLLARNKARTAGDRPALQHAIELEPQVEVQAPRIMFLHTEAMASRRAFAAFRFGAPLEVALRLVRPQPLRTGMLACLS
jgi:hypothetical protein